MVKILYPIKSEVVNSILDNLLTAIKDIKNLKFEIKEMKG